MKQFVVVLTLVAALMGSGCDATIGPVRGGKSVALFRDGKEPATPVEEIRLLTDEGSLGEQGAIEEKMIRQARRFGADALIFEEPTRVGEEFTGLGLTDTYLFRARAVIYKEAQSVPGI